ncbi:MFS transporter [Sulfuritalea sp.]|uniref:MFS transporter n=1 Tax=Sulfuritalea sp. TaxID=2480090 RepID=UPI00286E3B0C|nr:MFS transporter [Sulfuritalea sp.]
MKLPASMRALAHRPFRLYFCGQAVSILGSWIQQVALAWLVYRLTGSAALLGLAAFAALAPILVVGPLAGAWIDSHDRRRLLMQVQVLLFIQASALAALTWFELIGPSLIILMSLSLGVLNAFDTPLRQSLIPVMVGGRDDLPNALALNAMLFNLGRFIGPPIAGLMLGFMSEAACFLLNAFSYLALLWGVAAMRLAANARAAGSVGHVFKEGVRYAFDTWPIRTLLIVLALLNLTASAYAVLLPVFAKEVFHGDARTLGLLWGAAGCGAFVATLMLATRQSVRATLNLAIFCVVLAALALLAFPLSADLFIALPALAALGFGISGANVGINTVMQTIAPDRLRGRVVSFFSSIRFGLDAIGGLIAGSIAALSSAPAALLGEAALLVATGAWLLSRAGRLRHSLPS